MILGKWELPPYAMLAPMAGVSDRALRELAMRFGAVACVGEMVSCKGPGAGQPQKRRADGNRPAGNALRHPAFWR